MVRSVYIITKGQGRTCMFDVIGTERMATAYGHILLM
jgi:hypothetical protein